VDNFLLDSDPENACAVRETTTILSTAKWWSQCDGSQRGTTHGWCGTLLYIL